MSSKRSGDETIDEPDAKRVNPGEADWIHVKAIMTNHEAAIIIGKEGAAVSALRENSGARINISEQMKGAIERIITVSGPVEVVAKAYTSIVKLISGEVANELSTELSKTYRLRLAMAHTFLGAIIGTRGSRKSAIQTESGAKLIISEQLLPLSTERSLVVIGNADIIGKALLPIGTHVLEGKERFEHAHSVAYVPVTMYGRYGHPNSYRLVKPHDTMITPYNPYGIAPASFDPPPPATVVPSDATSAQFRPGGPGVPAAGGATQPGQPLTQHIFIPNDMVGAIIGKGGSKINEIRTLSGSHIKINEPDMSRTNERLITISGTGEQNQLALYMLYQRLESEKHR